MRHACLSAFLILALTAAAAQAQTTDQRGYVSGKIGGNIEEAEDGISGRSVGGGADGGILFSRFWGIDVELWIPAYFKSRGSDTRHRDILFNVSAVRFFGEARVRPFILLGLGIARVQENNPFFERFNNNTSYFVTGGGVQVPLGERLALVPEVRVNTAITALVVRPAIAVRYRF